jgi:hypothetical protein
VTLAPAEFSRGCNGSNTAENQENNDDAEDET